MTSIILLVLLAASGYCLWQIHLLRADVAVIREHVLQEQDAESQSIAEHARAALDALARGERERAQAELDRMAELVEESKSIVGEKRDQVRRRLEDAREAVAKGSADAADRVSELLRTLSRPWRLVDSKPKREPPAEQ